MLLALLTWLLAHGAPVPEEPARDRDLTRPSAAILAGTVRDPAGAPIEGAVVTIPLAQRTVITSRTGEYVLDALPQTELTVQFRALGRRPVTRRILPAGAGITRLDVVMEPSLIEVATLVVTGTPAGSTTLSPLDVDAVEPEQMRAAATASLGKTLERVPGVTNLSQGPAAGNPVLRGLSQGHVRIVRDGVPQESFQATARWFPPGNMSAVERIEVVRGPASVLYGPNAVGGAINLIPKGLPRTVGGRNELRGSAEANYFSNNVERYGHAEVHGARANGLGFRVGASRRLANDFRVPDIPSFGESNAPRAPLFSGRLPHTNFEQQGAYGQVGVAGAWGQLYANHDWWGGNNNFLNANGTPTAVSMGNRDSRLRGNLLLHGFVLKPTLLLQRADIRRNTQSLTFEEARRTGAWNQELRNDAATARMELHHPEFHGMRGTLGAEYNRQDVAVARSNIEPSSDTRNVGLFAFEEVQRSRLNLSAGVRFDHRRLAANTNPLVDRLPAGQRAEALTRSFSAVTGSVGFGVQVSAPLTLSVNGSAGFRPPSSLDLYTDEFRPVLLAFVEGDPQLSPERSYSVEASAKYQITHFSGSVVAYHNRMNNYVYLNKTDRLRARDGRSYPVFVNAQTDGWIRGIEASGSAELSPRVALDGSFSRLRSRNLVTGEQLPLMPADQARLTLRYVGGAMAALQAPYIEVGTRFVWAKQIAGLTEPFADAERNPQGPGVGSTNAYALANLGMGARVRSASDFVELHVAIENVFDSAYRDFLDTLKGVALGQGRNVSLRVVAPFALIR